MFGAVEYVRRSAVYRHPSGGCSRIRLLTGMQALCFKFKLLVIFQVLFFLKVGIIKCADGQPARRIILSEVVYGLLQEAYFIRGPNTSQVLHIFIFSFQFFLRRTAANGSIDKPAKLTRAELPGRALDFLFRAAFFNLPACF